MKNPHRVKKVNAEIILTLGGGAKPPLQSVLLVVARCPCPPVGFLGSCGDASPRTCSRKVPSGCYVYLFPPMAQSVYGVAEEGPQSHSPVHTPLHLCRKGTKEDVEKEVHRSGPARIGCRNYLESSHRASSPPSDLVPEHSA